MITKPIIIDNFLEEEYFNKLINLVCGSELAWFYGTWATDYNHPEWFEGETEEEKIARENPTPGEDALNYFFTHVMYIHHRPSSPHYDIMLPFCEKICEVHPGGYGIKSLIRMRANYFPWTSTIHEYTLHPDKEFSHTAALLSLNTCDGYTGILDEEGIVQKYHSIANRVIFFDAGIKHCSTTTTNARARFNLIVNYL